MTFPTYVDRSVIHGKGLFAGDHIPAGSIIGARGVQSIRRVARSVADLSASEGIEPQHVSVAVALRAGL